MTSLLSRISRTLIPAQRSTSSAYIRLNGTRAYSNHPRMLVSREIRASIQTARYPKTTLTTRNFSASAPVSVKRVKKYKLKTNHAAAARWKALANRMYKRRRAGKSHFNVKKSPAQLNRLGKDVKAVPYHVKHLKRLLPYA